MLYFASKFIVIALAGFAAAAPLRLTRRAFQEQEYVFHLHIVRFQYSS